MAGEAGNGGDDFRPTSGPAVGVVIVNHNGGDRVLRVLAALFRQSYPLARVVVVDNASTDNSRARIRVAHPTVRIIHLESNQGVAIARNIGLWALATPLVIAAGKRFRFESGAWIRSIAAHIVISLALTAAKYVHEVHR